MAGSSIPFCVANWRVAASIRKPIPAHESALLEASEGRDVGALAHPVNATPRGSMGGTAAPFLPGAQDAV
jgi:hypothetical protein